MKVHVQFARTAVFMAAVTQDNRSSAANVAACAVAYSDTGKPWI